MFNIELQWKEFAVDLEALHAWLKDNAGEHFTGTSADTKLTIHFTEEPSEEIKEAVEAKWDAIDEESAEVQSYKSAEQREADRLADKEAGKAVLLGLGLTEKQIAALLGV